jgi:hypothetical protein
MGLGWVLSQGMERGVETSSVSRSTEAGGGLFSSRCLTQLLKELVLGLLHAPRSFGVAHESSDALQCGQGQTGTQVLPAGQVPRWGTIGPICASIIQESGNHNLDTYWSVYLTERHDSRQLGLAKCPAQCSENLLERRQRNHLVGESSGPQRLRSRFFPRNCRLESRQGLPRNSNFSQIAGIK